MKYRRRLGDPVSVAVMDEVRALLQEITETTDEIRRTNAIIDEETSGGGDDQPEA